MEEKYKHVGGVERSFDWFIEHLLPPSDAYKGCECIFPDTVFFSGGKAKVIVKMDKDFCLSAVKNAIKLNNASIYKDFSNSFRDRRKSSTGIF